VGKQSAPAIPVGAERAAPAPRASSDSPYRELVEAEALDVLRLGPDGSSLTDLPGWRQLTGRPTPVRGLDWFDDLHPEDQATLKRAGLESAAPGRLIDVPMRVRAADGSYRRLVARMLGLAGPEGGVEAWIGRVEDVTEDVTARERADVLARATAALARTVTVEDVLVCIEHTLLDLVGAASCALLRPDPDGTPTAPLLRTAGHPITPLECEAVTLPLRSGTAVVGLWDLVLHPEAVQRPVLEIVAAQLAQALSRSQLLEHSLSTARQLQRALLPARLPKIPGLEVAARYRAPTGADVGGDWYDVLPLGSNRAGGSPGTGTVGLVLGDVMGRGVRAASTMGQVRNALRGIAVVDPTPEGMLTGLDRFFAGFDPDEITTLVITVLDPATGALHVGNAGHLPPLLLRADGRSGQLDDGASTPLGVPSERVACKGTTLLPGDLLVMCTDGLIERRHWSLSDGLAVLEAAARRLADTGMPLEQMADALLNEILDGSPTDDDVSLLLVRLPA
jgi:serine phosphatase RsbU (regulator of sigma subunit)